MLKNREGATMLKKQILVGMISILLVSLFSCSKQMSEEEIGELAKGIHERAITLDTHVDISSNLATPENDPGVDSRKQCNLPKMEKGGLDGVFLAVFVGQRGELNEEGYKRAYESAMGKFEAIHRMTKQMYPERCEFATRAEDVERIVKTGKRVILTGIENGFPVGEDLSLVKKYYDLGARYITLCHGGHNQICDSSGPDEPLHNGISEFGKKVVAEMNRLGIMCDVSHISDKSFWDLIEISKAPIIASHSACWNVNESGRNLKDDQLKALTKNGGVIQMIPMKGYIKNQPPEYRESLNKLREELGIPGRREMRGMSAEEREALKPKMEEFNKKQAEINKIYPPANLNDYINHIDHAVKVAGIDHVGIGTDFGGGGGLEGFNSHAECLNVTIELVKRGYSEEDIKKIWGGNLLRVMRDVAKVAAELQKEG